MMPTEEKVETKVIDLVTRLGLVDLTKPRSVGYKPVSQGESLLGVMSENLQRLDLLRYDLRKDALELSENIERIGSEHHLLHLGDPDGEHNCRAVKDEVDGLTDRLGTMLLEYQLINEIFWAMLWIEFPTASTKNVGIREDCQVVCSDDLEDESIVLFRAQIPVQR